MSIRGVVFGKFPIWHRLGATVGTGVQIAYVLSCLQPWLDSDHAIAVLKRQPVALFMTNYSRTILSDSKPRKALRVSTIRFAASSKAL